MKKEIRLEVYNKFDGCCAYCGDEIEYKAMQVDHIIPQRNFWSCVMNRHRIPSFLEHLTIDDVDHIDNLHPACRVCNKFKDTFNLELFRAELEKQLERTFKNSSSYRRALKFNQVVETPQPIVFYFEKV